MNDWMTALLPYVGESLRLQNVSLGFRLGQQGFRFKAAPSSFQ
jgi:hypothetical protein